MIAPRDWPLLRIFVAVAEAGSFTGAARQLGLGKSVVSLHVRTLEERCGVRLMERSTRQLRLTQVGELVLDAAREVLASVRDQLAAHGFPVTHAKRLAHLVRGVSNFYASPAHFAERLLEKCVEVAGTAGLRGALEPLAGDLDAAVSLLEAIAR